MNPARRLHVAPDDESVAPLLDATTEQLRPTPQRRPAPPPRLAPRPRPAGDSAVTGPPAAPAPPPLHRRPRPWLLVAVDGDPSSQAALVWSLREAARREATVVAVGVCPDPAPDDDWAPDSSPADRDVLQAELDARVQRAIAEAGVRPRIRTTVLDAQVFEAFVGAARGADLVLVGTHGKTLLRPAVARPAARRSARPA
jgi:nucleotide-binding universal stress UspA family protein